MKPEPLSLEEEISRAFDYGAKARHDRVAGIIPIPPENWPEQARVDWCDGYAWASEALQLKWGRHLR